MRAQFPPRGSASAFSLVEIAIALSLLAFCLVGLLALLQAGMQHERLSVDRVKASHILSALVDDIRGAGRARSGITPSQIISTPRYALPFPDAGAGAQEKIFKVDDDGIVSSDDDGDYVVYYRIEPPAADQGVFAPSLARLVIAWPGHSKVLGGETPSIEKSKGSEEIVMEVNRG